MSHNALSSRRGDRPRLVSRLWQYPPLLLGLLVLLGLLIVVLFGPTWGSYDPYLVAQSQRPYYNTELGKMITPPFPPSRQYPLGTDQWGNDLLSLILYGARTTLVAGFYISLLRVLLGALLGAMAGWREGRLSDRSVAAASTVVGSVPALLSSLVIIYALNIKNGLWVFLVALSVVGWTETAQLVRTEILRIRRHPFIEAAESVGLSPLQILVRHFLPNLLPYLLVIMALEMSAVLLLMAELGFLGTFIGGTSLYIPDVLNNQTFFLPETPEWGALVAQGAPFFRAYPNIILAPTLAFVIASVGLNVLGEGLRWLFDRWPVSTAFLLRKRTLAAGAVLAMVSVFIISMTGAKTSFIRVAHSFEVERAMNHADALAALAGQPDAIDAYLEKAFVDFHVQRGYKAGILANYHHNYQIRMAGLLEPPVLSIDATSLRFGEDFVVAENSIASSGDSDGVLTLVPQRSFYGIEDLPKNRVRDHVFMVWEATTPSYFVPMLASRGAAGVLLVSETADFAVQNTLLLDTPDAEQSAFPIFRITPQAAEHLLAVHGLSLADTLQGGDRPRTLDVQVHMSLHIQKQASVPVHNSIGFLGGYDSNLAQEMLVLFVPYDSRFSEPSQFLGLGIMLEMLRTWQENHVDPRRSLLLVAWDNASLGSPGAALYLANNDNFEKLTGLASSAPLRPHMIWQLSPPTTADNTLWIDPASDAKLVRLQQQADLAVRSSLAVRVAPTASTTPNPILSLPAPALAPVSGQASASFDVESNSQALGEMLSYLLLQRLRQVQ